MFDLTSEYGGPPVNNDCARQRPDARGVASALQLNNFGRHLIWHPSSIHDTRIAAMK
jgi:hypothetical protein